MTAARQGKRRPKRIGLVLMIAFAFGATPAYAAFIDPFNLPYYGPAEDGAGEVGFKVKQDPPRVAHFQFDSISADCEGAPADLADEVDDTARILDGEFHLRGAGLNNPRSEIVVHGIQAENHPHRYRGWLRVPPSHWKGLGECETDGSVVWSASRAN